MKKVLLIVYYWPPAGGGGVQRWLKFTRYLPEFGWEPIVYTPENADHPLRDETLLDQVPADIHVIHRPIFEPRKIYRQLLVGKNQDRPEGTDEVFYRTKEDRSFAENLSLWIRGNLFIPDARVTWVRPSVKWLSVYLNDNPVDAIVTSGPPHSLHLIGRALKRRLGVPWVADFRDPWTDIEYYDKMMLSRLGDQIHRKLERSVFTEADAIVDVSPHWESVIREGGGRRVVTITNGFDPSDFPDKQTPLSDRFLVSHIGTLSLDRNPEILWQALKELCDTVPGFEQDLAVDLVGKTDPAVLESAADCIGDKVVDSGYVTHTEAIVKMQASQVLLLLINQAANNAPGRMTGKIFEYMAAGRPILLIGPADGDAATLVSAGGLGAAVKSDDLGAMKSVLSEWYSRFQNGTLTVSSEDIDRFSRRSLTRRYASLLSEITCDL